MADRWPFDSIDFATDGDETGYVYGGKGLSRLCLAQAVQVDFTFETRGFERRLSKSIHLRSSLWNECVSGPFARLDAAQPGRYDLPSWKGRSFS